MKLKVTQDSSSNLVYNYSIYQALSGLSGIPKVYWYGREGLYNVIVLNHLGSTFEEIAQKSIDTKAVFAYVILMVFLFFTRFIHLYLSQLSILKLLHNQHYIHFNTKPNNFMLSIGKLSNQVFLINFGLAQLFCNLVTCSHIM